MELWVTGAQTGTDPKAIGCEPQAKKPEWRKYELS